eukprot:m.424709 g.424709  ORF g.424709 m.424709 type:complete len:65 (+) comp16856_c0_seq78:1066-1260(+)
MYGPAQCKIENVRWGGHIHADSHTAGWVFLLPEATDPDFAATDNGSADAAAAAAADMPEQIDFD